MPFLCVTLCPLWLEFSPVITINHALDSISKVDDIEIDEQSDLPFAQAHIGEQLSLVDGIDGFNALHLDNHSIGDDQINAITEIDVLSIVDDWQSDLTGNRDALFPKLVQQAGMICAFQQARP